MYMNPNKAAAYLISNTDETNAQSATCCNTCAKL